MPSATDQRARHRPAAFDPSPRASRILWGVTVAWVTWFVYLGLVPRLPEVGSLDDRIVSSWGHAIGTLVLAALVYLLLAKHPRRSRGEAAAIVLGAAVLFGGLIELLQWLGGERDPSLGDLLLDAAGAVVAVVLLTLTRRPLEWWARVVAGFAIVVIVATVPLVIVATPPDRSSRCEPRPVRTARAGGSTAAAPVPIVHYTFEEGSGSIAANLGTMRPQVGLDLVRPGVGWVQGGGLSFDGGAARSPGPARGVVRAIDRAGAFTVEARVRPGRLDQDGPARIVTSSGGIAEDEVNVHLGQEGTALSVRVRARCGDFNWTVVPDVFTTRRPVHVAVTFAGRVQRVFVQGRNVDAQRFAGRLGAWNPAYPLAVGNEVTMDRAWDGDVFDVAIYDEALPPAAVADRAASEGARSS